MNEASHAVLSKVCTACSARYPADALFCPNDGSPLRSVSAASRDSQDSGDADPYLGLELEGHIVIEQLIGIGAMGRVYRAFQRGIDRAVAVKILHRELSANAQLVSRFTREAKVASRLSHPNVVQVLLAGQLPDRALYMVMEYLDGLSLQSALAAASGAFPLSRALHIGLQLCEAAGEAHAQGIVHRDLKPENVMLVRRGVDDDFVKVLDFGIARANWGEQSMATAAGLVFGTARYISPEGAQGNAVGPASDVYSIATLFYQLLSGRTPFEGDQAVGLLVAQIHDPPPDLRSFERSAYVPPPIAKVIMQNLAKEPSAREPDARSLGHAIIDAAREAGLAPDDISRPILQRRPSAMQLSPMERTKKLDLTPEVEARMNAATRIRGPEARDSWRAGPPATSATVKWEPPREFAARLQETAERPSEPRRASVVPTPIPTAGRPRVPSGIDETLDDHSSEPAYRTHPPAATSVPKTMPGEALDTPPVARTTEYSEPMTPARERTTMPPRRRSKAPGEGPSRGVMFLVVFCFVVLGAAFAGVLAWKMGRLGPSSDAELEERFVARATDAMFKNRFTDPPGENVRDITAEGLRRFPNASRLVDVRVRAANELVTHAMAQRAAGDIPEALRLATSAHELDPNDGAAKRLVEQYERELAAQSAATTSPLVKPPVIAPTKPAGSAPPHVASQSSSARKEPPRPPSSATASPNPTAPASAAPPASTPLPAPTPSVKWM